MRLSPADCAVIKRKVADRIGAAAAVRLFGSRTDDSLRGGDIDVFVDAPDPIPSRLRLECALAADLERAFEGRRVDVVVAAPNLPDEPIHVLARRSGIAL